MKQMHNIFLFRASDLVGIVSLKLNEVNLRLSFKVEQNTQRLNTFPIDLKA